MPQKARTEKQHSARGKEGQPDLRPEAVSGGTRPCCTAPFPPRVTRMSALRSGPCPCRKSVELSLPSVPQYCEPGCSLRACDQPKGPFVRPAGKAPLTRLPAKIRYLLVQSNLPQQQGHDISLLGYSTDFIARKSFKASHFSQRESILPVEPC